MLPFSRYSYSRLPATLIIYWFLFIQRCFMSKKTSWIHKVVGLAGQIKNISGPHLVWNDFHFAHRPYVVHVCCCNRTLLWGFKRPYRRNRGLVVPVCRGQSFGQFDESYVPAFTASGHKTASFVDLTIFIILTFIGIKMIPMWIRGGNTWIKPYLKIRYLTTNLASPALTLPGPSYPSP